MAQHVLDHPAIALQMLDCTPTGGELGSGKLESASNCDDALGEGMSRASQDVGCLHESFLGSCHHQRSQSGKAGSPEIGIRGLEGVVRFLRCPKLGFLRFGCGKRLGEQFLGFVGTRQDYNTKNTGGKGYYHE